MKCNACGKEFELLKENRYVVQKAEEVQFTILNIGKNDVDGLYDAFDCPYCGCQNVVNKREGRIIQEAESKKTVIEEENSENSLEVEMTFDEYVEEILNEPQGTE